MRLVTATNSCRAFFPFQGREACAATPCAVSSSCNIPFSRVIISKSKPPSGIIVKSERKPCRKTCPTPHSPLISSSEVSNNPTRRLIFCATTCFIICANAATGPFMSAAPRPKMRSPSIFGSKNERFAGTTSTCPTNNTSKSKPELLAMRREGYPFFSNSEK